MKTKVSDLMSSAAAVRVPDVQLGFASQPDPRGLYMVSGPTEAGMSTTLHLALAKLPEHVQKTRVAFHGRAGGQYLNLRTR